MGNKIHCHSYIRWQVDYVSIDVSFTTSMNSSPQLNVAEWENVQIDKDNSQLVNDKCPPFVLLSKWCNNNNNRCFEVVSFVVLSSSFNATDKELIGNVQICFIYSFFFFFIFRLHKQALLSCRNSAMIWIYPNYIRWMDTKFRNFAKSTKRSMRAIHMRQIFYERYVEHIRV